MFLVNHRMVSFILTFCLVFFFFAGHLLLLLASGLTIHYPPYLPQDICHPRAFDNGYMLSYTLSVALLFFLFSFYFFFSLIPLCDFPFRFSSSSRYLRKVQASPRYFISLSGHGAVGSFSRIFLLSAFRDFSAWLIYLVQWACFTLCLQNCFCFGSLAIEYRATSDVFIVIYCLRPFFFFFVRERFAERAMVGLCYAVLLYAMCCMLCAICYMN